MSVRVAGSLVMDGEVSAHSSRHIYTCSRYNKYGVAHCTQHRIKYDTLYNIVLEQIRACARKALADEQEAAAQLRENCQADEQAEREAIQRSIDEDSERITALERIISRVYEDMIAHPHPRSDQGQIRLVFHQFSNERPRCAIIPCDEFSCPIKFTNRDTINWTFRGKNRTMGLEHKEVHYGRINLYESRRLLYPRSDT